jgi:hypothetical protein
MHTRIQFDPNIQMNALFAAARAEALREALRIRKELRNFASALATEYDGADCVVKLSGDDASQGQPSQQNQGDQKNQNDEPDPESDANPASYWA